MRKLLTAAKTWGHKAFLAARAFEEAMDYRYEDHAQGRFERLEQRVASLEARHGLPRQDHTVHP
jgi:hypothetical protein